MTSPADATGDLPNLPLLIKLLKMTTSSHDAEALMAIRRANEQLKKFGGDWESLLKGKVTVIANPFAGTTPPIDESQIRNTPPHAQKPSAPPQPKPRPQAPRSNLNWMCTGLCGRSVNHANTLCSVCLAAQQKARAKPQPKPQPAAKPQRKAAAFSNVDKVTLDDIV